MGYRPHIVKQYEISYGDSIHGFCYKSDGFGNKTTAEIFFI